MADPGSLGDLGRDDGQSQVGSQQSEDPDIEPDREDLDPMNLLDRDPSLWPPVDPEFVPLVDELRTSIDFVKALRCASLNNDDLTEDALARLRHPPQHVLEIQDPNELYSLKQYLATQNASQQTYHDIRSNHTDRFPDIPMLSYAQVKRRVSEWSGVDAIVNDMCPDSCMAYTGPFADLEKCPLCSHSRYDPIRLAMSNGRVKIPIQQFYTLPIGPQVQALWRTPESARNMQHRRNQTDKILQQMDQDDGILRSYDDLYHGSEYLSAYIRGDIAPMTQYSCLQFYAFVCEWRNNNIIVVASALLHAWVGPCSSWW